MTRPGPPADASPDPRVAAREVLDAAEKATRLREEAYLVNDGGQRKGIVARYGHRRALAEQAEAERDNLNRTAAPLLARRVLEQDAALRRIATAEYDAVSTARMIAQDALAASGAATHTGQEGT